MSNSPETVVRAFCANVSDRDSEKHICRVANLARDNQPWPSACALQLYPSDYAEEL